MCSLMKYKVQEPLVDNFLDKMLRTYITNKNTIHHFYTPPPSIKISRYFSPSEVNLKVHASGG